MSAPDYLPPAEAIEELEELGKIHGDRVRVMDLDRFHTSGYTIPWGSIPDSMLDVSALELLALARADELSQEQIRPILNAHLKDGAT